MERDTKSMLHKKLSIKDLIANAEQIRARKRETRELFIKSLDATITIQKLDRRVILDSYDMEENEGNMYLAYEGILEPSFKDTALQETYGSTGYQVLEEILDPGEIDLIAKEVVQFAGYGDSVSLIETTKNS